MNYTETIQAPEIEIYYKSTIKTKKRPQIKCGADVFNLISSIPEMQRNVEYKELFYALYLNKANEVLAIHKISEGATDRTIVDIKFIMQGAILTNSSNMIILHNHPSGNLIPSENDKSLTSQIKKAAQLFNIELLDSFTINADCYFSFLEHNLI